MLRSPFIAAILAVVVSSSAADDPARTEAQKIERLIEHVGKLGKAKFVRNDVEYDAAAAEKFLRAKWKSMGSDIKSAAEFIEKIASKSSTTGKPYLIRFPGGKERNSGEYLAEQLKKETEPPAGASPKYKEEKVTLTGTVKDEDGNPIKDVTVYVFAQCFDLPNLDEELRACRQLAKTESRENGEYEFRDLAIKILDKPDPLVIGAALELLAIRKDGKAVWRGAYMLVKNADAAAGNQGAIAPGTQKQIDLVFRPTKPITGRVFDEGGKPIAGAVIRLINCRPVTRQFPAKTPETESLSHSLGGKQHAAPETVAERKSDAEGRFEFGGIPVDMRGIFIVNHADFSMAWLGATNTEDEIQGVTLEGDLKWQRGEVKVRLRKTYPVPVEVKLAGSDEPAAGAMVAAHEMKPADKLSAASGVEFANEKGGATLRLPTGNFKVRAAYEGTLSREVTEVEIAVTPAPQTKPLTLQAPAPTKSKR